MEGKKYGALTVVKENVGKTKFGDKLCLCICDCGEETTTRSTYLKNGHTKSCGCGRTTNLFKHGMYDSKEYRSYIGMIRACYTESDKWYGKCGAVGIKVCDSWLDSFNNFINDVGRASDENHILIRINIDDDFHKNNVRWGGGAERVARRKKLKGTSSKFKGVSWSKSKNKFKSEIMHNGKRKYLGSFDCEKEAFEAYREAHIQMKGYDVIHGEVESDE
ncbi:hypothetical protein JC794_08305 [Morganella morganii]|uniref:AP2 domain-containing protein n=1 Tax=Morganella morganii TaxID=582 RepID=UPI001C45FCCD|nr:AP2 domain-containing protein [Morganella morganii]QXO59281.1 hypothetical protein JC827_08295 [Morganella morganii]QXO78250.1 hypothetical protein JC794_08305 [Morganella morganii]